MSNLDEFFPVPIAELYRFFAGMLDIFFGNVSWPAIEVKEHGELVSSVDMMVERRLLEFLGSAYPGYELVSEESRAHWPPANGNFCLVDPLDGTHDYLMGAPVFGTMFAAFENFQPRSSAIFLPSRAVCTHGGLLVAARGRDAYEIFSDGQKSRRLEVSSQRELRCATLLFEAPQRKRLARIFRQAETKAHRTRRFGSTAYSAAMVAAGGTMPRGADALIIVANKPWDILPAALLVTEAGGTATDLRGLPLQLQSDSVILSNGNLHRHLVALSAGSKR